MELRTACFVTFFSLAGMAQAEAQETAGTISGTLGLEDATWYVTSGPDENPSGWHWIGNEVEVRLFGQVRRDAQASTDGALMISMRTEGNPSDMSVSEFAISYMPEKAPENDVSSYSADGVNADLDIETLVISDDEMVVTGSFAGKLIPGGADDLVLDQEMRSVTVDGNFQATLPKLSSD